MKMQMFRNQKEYNDYVKTFQKERVALANYIGNKLYGRFPIWQRLWQKIFKRQPVIYGFCKVCKKPVSFQMRFNFSDECRVPNYRESLHCPNCNLSNRQRFIATYMSDHIKKNFLEDLTIYVYEQVTPFFKRINKIYSENHTVIGSEYLRFDLNPGEVISGTRHEDALNLSFKSESIDMLISQDVLEHVPDYKKAIAESFRVLQKQGIFLFSIPFDTGKEKTVQRSRLTEKELIHDLPESYHGNPIDNKGSLVFFDFGWDILNCFLKIGFKDVCLLSYYDMFFGHIGGSDQFCFLAIK